MELLQTEEFRLMCGDLGAMTRLAEEEVRVAARGPMLSGLDRITGLDFEAAMTGLAGKAPGPDGITGDDYVAAMTRLAEEEARVAARGPKAPGPDGNVGGGGSGEGTPAPASGSAAV